MQASEKALANKRLVIKVGSSLVTNGGQGVHTESIRAWGSQIARLKAQGCEVVLVSSGAIAEGLKRLGWAKRPKEINELQAAAAVGQMGLVHAYEMVFAEFNITCAQVLLTHADLSTRTQAPAPTRSPSHGRGYFNAWRKAVSTAEEGASQLFE